MSLLSLLLIASTDISQGQGVRREDYRRQGHRKALIGVLHWHVCTSTVSCPGRCFWAQLHSSMVEAALFESAPLMYIPSLFFLLMLRHRAAASSAIEAIGKRSVESRRRFAHRIHIDHMTISVREPAWWVWGIQNDVWLPLVCVCSDEMLVTCSWSRY